MRHPAAGFWLATAPRATSSRAASVPLKLDTNDARSDDGRRHVEILSDGVVVERQIAGVRMRLALALADYRGVALSVRREPPGLRLAVTLVHRDRDLDVLLFEAGDDRDITAEWIYWSKRFNLPLLVTDANGDFSQPYGQLGALSVSQPSPRRRGSILSRRRPRFLVRRQTGRTDVPAVIHVGREIIAPC